MSFAALMTFELLHKTFLYKMAAWFLPRLAPFMPVTGNVHVRQDVCFFFTWP
jgi:hypothetical protein